MATYITIEGICCACGKPCIVSAMEEEDGTLMALSTCCWSSAIETPGDTEPIQIEALEYKEEMTDG